MQEEEIEEQAEETIKTIGDEIKERVYDLEKTYRILKKCENKNPASLIHSKAFIEKFIAEKVFKKIKEKYEAEKNKEMKKREKEQNEKTEKLEI